MKHSKPKVSTYKNEAYPIVEKEQQKPKLILSDGDFPTGLDPTMSKNSRFTL